MEIERLDSKGGRLAGWLLYLAEFDIFKTSRVSHDDDDGGVGHRHTQEPRHRMALRALRAGWGCALEDRLSSASHDHYGFVWSSGFQLFFFEVLCLSDIFFFVNKFSFCVADGSEKCNLERML